MDLERYATIQQTSRHPGKTSEAYRFISTKEVLGAFADLGWFPAQVVEAGVRKPENAGYQAHIVRLENPTFHAREIAVGDAVGQIVLKTSHNGQSSFHLLVGMLEKVCSNGLMVDRNDRISIPHIDYGPWMVHAAVERVSRLFRGAFEERERWQRVQLGRDAQLAFADAAIALRFDTDAVEVDPRSLLVPLRWQQAEPTLWNVFNTIQEHLIRGGVRQVRTDLSSFRSRAVRDIDENVRINRALWRLAAELERAVN
jgi:hypothetical protein